MKTIFILLLTLFINQGYCQSVLFGERDFLNQTNKLYFDKEGTMYPDFTISNNALTAAGNNLKDYYKINPQTFILIATKYALDFKEFNQVNFDQLQSALISATTQNLQIRNKDVESITFLIHGFRKPYIPIVGEYSSQEDFKMLTDGLKKFQTKPTKFIEVYWDSYYDCCFGKNTRKNKKLFQLFEKAQVNATYVASSFRKILSGINYNQINIITHSLGAKVATQALINLDVIDSKISTPDTPKINVCLIAPAIGGKDISVKFWDRTTTLNYKYSDNYHILVVYNTNDFVLKKRVSKFIFNFGPGPYKYGITTLGCNFEGDADNLEKYFSVNYPNAEIKLIDHSNVGSCHYLGLCYSAGDNLKEIVNFIEK